MKFMNPNTLRERILNKIKDGGVKMHSRAHYILRLTIVVVVSVVVFILSALVVSFIIFSIEEGGEQFLLGFGLRGISTFLTLFPWLLLIIDVIAILALRLILQRFQIIYRHSFVVVLVTLFIISFVLALLINLTPTHSYLLERADKQELPIFGPIYSGLHIPNEKMGQYKGEITTINGRTLTIVHNDMDYDDDDGVHEILIPENLDLQLYSVGDTIYIAGDDEGQYIKAYGIQRTKER